MKKLSTFLNHPPVERLGSENFPLTSPIYQSVKFATKPYRLTQEIIEGKHEGYLYSRNSNPTTRELERTLAQAQNCEDGLVLSSGIAAISLSLFSLCRPGDHIISFYQLYSSTQKLLKGLLSQYQIHPHFCSIDDLREIENLLQNHPVKVLIFETPTNPVLRIADIQSICLMAQKHHCLTVLDNTFGGLHQHQNHPIDLYIHSLTKYANGHGDVLGGAILGSKKILHSIRQNSFVYGASLDPHAAFLIKRGLKTYSLRYTHQSRSAQSLAQWLEKQPVVIKVSYPGLPSYSDFALAKKQMVDFGSVIAFDLNLSQEQITCFFENLAIFHITPSLGSTESLIAPVLLFYGAALTALEQKKAGITPQTIRLAIGLEDIEDLKEDLTKAWNKALCMV